MRRWSEKDMRKGDKFMERKKKAVKVLTRAALMIKAFEKDEVSFEEFEERYQSRKKFLQTFKMMLKKFASRPIKFLDPEGEALIYVDLRSQKFIIKRLR